MAQDSKIKVNSIVHKTDGQPVVIAYGATVPSTGSLVVNGNCNLSGVVTATSFTGSGADLNNVPVVGFSKAAALQILGL